jgi:hypothetical protein
MVRVLERPELNDPPTADIVVVETPSVCINVRTRLRHDPEAVDRNDLLPLPEVPACEDAHAKNSRRCLVELFHNRAYARAVGEGFSPLPECGPAAQRPTT